MAAYLSDGIENYLTGLYFSYISKNNSMDPLHSLDGALEISGPNSLPPYRRRAVHRCWNRRKMETPLRF